MTESDKFSEAGLPKIDPRKLMMLTEVIEHGSVTKGAAALGISQPALSKMLRQLESELGVSLLERSASGVVTTPSGAMLYNYAKAIGVELRNASRDLQLLSQHRDKLLVIGVLPSLIRGVVAPAALRWRDRYPDWSLRIVEKYQVDLLSALYRGELDFVIARGETQTQARDIRQQLLFRDRCCAISIAGHALDTGGPLNLRTASRYPWAFPSSASSQRSLLERLFREAGAPRPEVHIEYDSVDMMTALVMQGNYLGIMARHAIDPEIRAGTMVELMLKSTLLTRDISLMVRDSRPLAAQGEVFVSILADVGLRATLDAQRR